MDSAPRTVTAEPCHSARCERLSASLEKSAIRFGADPVQSVEHVAVHSARRIHAADDEEMPPIDSQLGSREIDLPHRANTHHTHGFMRSSSRAARPSRKYTTSKYSRDDSQRTTKTSGVRASTQTTRVNSNESPRFCTTCARSKKPRRRQPSSRRRSAAARRRHPSRCYTTGGDHGTDTHRQRGIGRPQPTDLRSDRQREGRGDRDDGVTELQKSQKTRVRTDTRRGPLAPGGRRTTLPRCQREAAMWRASAAPPDRAARTRRDIHATTRWPQRS